MSGIEKIFFAHPQDGKKLCLHLWKPDGQPKMRMQICHGMAEHLSRYGTFAEKLNEKGILVFGIDHPGHGESDGIRGHFADKNGWEYLLLANMAAKEQIPPEYPGLPFVLFGHSMGSFVARSIAAKEPSYADGYIFMGTAGKNPALPIGKALADTVCALGGGKRQNRGISVLCFGSYARSVKDARTDFDWLTCDGEMVDRYVADVECGFPFTGAGYASLFRGLGEISRKTWAPSLDKEKPYLLLSGAEDPVGDNTKGVLWVEKQMKDAGVKNVGVKFYPGCRHEILNDFSRDEVTEDILRWLSDKFVC